jgi:uncharacterized protein YggE
MYMKNIIHNTEQNKNIVLLLGGLALGALTLVALVIAIREIRFMATQSMNSTFITVSGKGEVASAPDIAEVTFTIRETSTKVADGQKIVKDKTKAVVAELKAMNIDEKDIKTLSYSSSPKYEYKNVVCDRGYCPPSNPVVVGFDIVQTVQVKVRNVDQVGTVFEKIGGFGISELSGPNFTIDDIEKIKDEARGLAIADAKEKAQVLAKQLGLRIVRISDFNEGADTTGYPMPMYEKSMMQSVQSDSAMTENAANGIMQGENTTIAQVTIEYEVQKR